MVNAWEGEQDEVLEGEQDEVWVISSQFFVLNIFFLFLKKVRSKTTQRLLKKQKINAEGKTIECWVEKIKVERWREEIQKPTEPW